MKATAMNPLGLQVLPLVEIAVGDRLRAIDEGYARLLAENIEQTGVLRQPIEVRRLGDGRYGLIAGGHRLRAAELLGWTEIPAFVFQGGDLLAQLAEIDENLIRRDLDPLDRAVFLARRKALHEKLYPEARHGAQGGRGGKRNETDTMSFSKATAERCGLTERTIRRAVAIATRLTGDSRRRIVGTDLAKKQSELLALSRLDAADQAAVLDLLLPADGAAPQARGVAAARRLLAGARPENAPASQTLTRLLHLWGRASRAERRAFLRHLHETGQVAGLLADAAHQEEEAA